MCGKLRNEDKDNIDQDSDVCTIGVQNVMQSYYGTSRNQKKIKIPLTPMLFYRLTSWCEKSKVCIVLKIKFCIIFAGISQHQINESHHDAFCYEFPKRDQPGAKQYYRNNFSHEKN